MLLTSLVLIVLAAYILESFLDHLNQSRARDPLDSSIANLYDAEERERSISYTAEKTRFSFLVPVFQRSSWSSLSVMAGSQLWITGFAIVLIIKSWSHSFLSLL